MRRGEDALTQLATGTFKALDGSVHHLGLPCGVDHEARRGRLELLEIARA